MKYDHRVKVNGKWFDAGVEVDSTPVNVEVSNSQTEDEDIEKPQTEDEDIENPQYSRTDIQKLTKAEAIEVAIDLGIEINEEMTSNDIKGKILAHLGI